MAGVERGFFSGVNKSRVAGKEVVWLRVHLGQGAWFRKYQSEAHWVRGNGSGSTSPGSLGQGTWFRKYQSGAQKLPFLCFL